LLFIFTTSLLHADQFLLYLHGKNSFVVIHFENHIKLNFKTSSLLLYRGIKCYLALSSLLTMKLLLCYSTEVQSYYLITLRLLLYHIIILSHHIEIIVLLKLLYFIILSSYSIKIIIILYLLYFISLMHSYHHIYIYTL